MVGSGEIEQVRTCGKANGLNLDVRYVHRALLMEKVGAGGHNASLQSLGRCLEKERAGRSHLGEFLDRRRASSRSMPMFIPDGRAKLASAPLDDEKLA